MSENNRAASERESRDTLKKKTSAAGAKSGPEAVAAKKSREGMGHMHCKHERKKEPNVCVLTEAQSRTWMDFGRR